MFVLYQCDENPETCVALLIRYFQAARLRKERAALYWCHICVVPSQKANTLEH